jgi:hypothetical protein
MFRRELAHAERVLAAVSEGGRSAAVPTGGYAAEVVAALTGLRRRGVSDFDRAWSIAMRDLPAPWSWRPRLAYQGEAPLVFLERQCRLAWEGEIVAQDLHSLADD